MTVIVSCDASVQLRGGSHKGENLFSPSRAAYYVMARHISLRIRGIQ